MCRGCLVPFREHNDPKIQDYLDKFDRPKSLEEYYEGGEELALRLTWNKRIPINLLQYLIYSSPTVISKPEERKFDEGHPEKNDDDAPKDERNYE